MKKLVVMVAACALALALAGCGSGETTPPAEGSDNTEIVEPAQPADLSGTWVQVNKESEGSYQEAVISGDTIEVNWISPDTKSLYWAGTFVAPTTADEPYVWTSENDTEKTSVAILASTAETKDFTYADGQLSYEVTALGVTKTVRMEKQE